MDLRVVTLDRPGVADLNGNGYIMDIFFEMLRRVEVMGLPIAPTFYIPQHSPFHGSLSNGSWTGAIGELHRGAADIAVLDMSHTPVRSSVVDFTISLYEEQLSIISLSTGGLSSVSPWNIFDNEITRPLSGWVWLVWILTILGTGLAIKLISHGSWSGQSRLFMWTMGTPFIESSKTWIIWTTAGLAVSSMFMWRIHSSRYIASIVNADTVMKGSISDVRDSPQNFFVTPQSSTLAYFRNLGMGNKAEEFSSIQSALSQIRSGTHSSVVGESRSMWRNANLPPCDMGMIKIPEGRISIAFALNRQFARKIVEVSGREVVVMDLLNEVLFSMKQHAAVELIMDKYWTDHAKCSNVLSSRKTVPFQLKEMGFVFVIYSTCIAIGVILTCTEHTGVLKWLPLGHLRYFAVGGSVRGSGDFSRYQQSRHVEL